MGNGVYYDDTSNLLKHEYFKKVGKETVVLHAKHLCKLTVIVGPPTETKTFRNMGNHEYFEYERSLNELFDLLYGCHYNGAGIGTQIRLGSYSQSF